MMKEDERKVVFQKGGHVGSQATVENFLSLLPGEWLVDDIVNCYVIMTQELLTRWNSKVKLLNSHFFAKLELQVTYRMI